MSSTASSLGPVGSGLLRVPSLQVGIRPVARVGREEQGERQRDLQQPSSPHGAAGRHSLRRQPRLLAPRAPPGSCCPAVPPQGGPGLAPAALLSRRAAIPLRAAPAWTSGSDSQAAVAALLRS